MRPVWALRSVLRHAQPLRLPTATRLCTAQRVMAPLALRCTPCATFVSATRPQFVSHTPIAFSVPNRARTTVPASAAASASSSAGPLPRFSKHFSPHTVVSFTYRNTDYYIVGTAHISRLSADEVRTVIEKTAPDAIMIELDAQRYLALPFRFFSSRLCRYSSVTCGVACSVVP
jgi:hypothetical protein